MEHETTYIFLPALEILCNFMPAPTDIISIKNKSQVDKRSNLGVLTHPSSKVVCSNQKNYHSRTIIPFGGNLYQGPSITQTNYNVGFFFVCVCVCAHARACVFLTCWRNNWATGCTVVEGSGFIRLPKHWNCRNFHTLKFIFHCHQKNSCCGGIKPTSTCNIISTEPPR